MISLNFSPLHFINATYPLDLLSVCAVLPYAIQRDILSAKAHEVLREFNTFPHYSQPLLR